MPPTSAAAAYALGLSTACQHRESRNGDNEAADRESHGCSLAPPDATSHPSTYENNCSNFVDQYSPGLLFVTITRAAETDSRWFRCSALPAHPDAHCWLRVTRRPPRRTKRPEMRSAFPA